jgi:hypothetical protein
MRNTRVHIPSLIDKEERRRNLHIPTDLPIVFSAGPIRNAPKWQNDAIRIADQCNRKVFFVSPAWSVDPDQMDLVEPDREEYKTFVRQRQFEQHYMYNAAERGCVFFWLCQESPNKEFPEKVYAHITMLELGKWIERKKLLPNTHLVIGTDGKFPELSTIEYELSVELPTLPIYRSLEETVQAALAIATQTQKE